MQTPLQLCVCIFQNDSMLIFTFLFNFINRRMVTKNNQGCIQSMPKAGLVHLIHHWMTNSHYFIALTVAVMWLFYQNIMTTIIAEKHRKHAPILWNVIAILNLPEIGTFNILERFRNVYRCGNVTEAFWIIIISQHM